MYRIVLLAVFAVAFTTGCKKSKPTDSDTPPPPPYVSSGGGPAAPNQQGNLTVHGGEGAIQAPRMAAARLVNQIEMNQLYTSMFQTWTLDNRVPSNDEVMKEAQQNPQLRPLLKEEVILLTGATRGDQIWAYTQYPQRAGDHYVITQQGVEQMSPEVLRKRLEGQGAPIKMSR
jgi:hypothetical protein